jgi:hypothetical protein
MKYFLLYILRNLTLEARATTKSMAGVLSRCLHPSCCAGLTLMSVCQRALAQFQAVWPPLRSQQGGETNLLILSPNPPLPRLKF